jgi:O-antigen/teichoic acid export membrane protein
MHGDALRAKAARGGMSLGTGTAAEQVCRFARNMLLARLLMPSAFGTMAIVMSSSSIITAISDVGLGPAVIQHPRGTEDSFLDAAWWLGLIRAVFIYAFVFATAPWVARFYVNPQLNGLLRVTLLATILDAMLSPRSKRIQKEMKFGRYAMIINGGSILGVITTVVLAFVLRSVWALAFGYCAENIFRCLFSYILCPGLPSLKIDRTAYRELIHFSKGMFGLSFLNLVFSRADIFVLGKLVTANTLGLYTLAVYLVQTPATFLINMMGSLLLPAFSHVRGDKERSNRMLSKVTSGAILLGVPIVMMFWFCGSSVLTVVYGARYAVGGTTLAIAGIVAFLNILNNFITSLFFAEGKPALHRRAVAASAVVMVICIYPICHFMGIVGGQVSALIAIVVSYLLQVERARDVSGLRVTRYARALLPAICVSGVVALAGVGTRVSGLVRIPVADIAICCAGCALAYLLYVPMLSRMRELV